MTANFKRSAEEYLFAERRGMKIFRPNRNVNALFEGPILEIFIAKCCPFFSFPDAGEWRQTTKVEAFFINSEAPSNNTTPKNQPKYSCNQVNFRQIFQFTSGAHRTTALTVGTGPVPSQAIQKPACLFVCNRVVLRWC